MGGACGNLTVQLSYKFFQSKEDSLTMFLYRTLIVFSNHVKKIHLYDDTKPAKNRQKGEGGKGTFGSDRHGGGKSKRTFLQVGLRGSHVCVWGGGEGGGEGERERQKK